MGFINTHYKLPSNSAIDEAFKASDLKKVYDIITDFLSSKLGSAYKWGHEIVNNEEGTFNGYRYSVNGQFIRFNWTGENSAKISSVDIWKKNGGKKPNIHLDVNDWSIVKILPAIVDIIKDPSLPVDAVDESYLSEAKISYKGEVYKTMNSAIEVMVNDGLGTAQIAKIVDSDERIVIGRIKSIFKAGPGRSETVSSDSETKAQIKLDTVKKKAEEGQYTSIKAVRDDLPALVRMAGRPASKVNSIFICGGAGQGKCVSGDVEINVEIG